MAEKALADMLELIKCPVCWQGPRDPHQCPQCSKPFCHVCIAAALNTNGKCPFCRIKLKMEVLVRCPWLDDVRSMAEKAGESLRKCEVHTDQLMTHFDTKNKRPACKNCADENEGTVCTLEEAKQKKEDDILKEIEGIGDATKVFWENQVIMKKNFENFTQFGDNLCTELSRVLSDQTQTLEEHMNSVRNALNEIKVLIPKKLVEEVKGAAKERVYEFLTEEWCGSKETDTNDKKFILKIEDIRQLELETSARHSETMKVGDRNWFVDVGLLNVHKVGGWESDDHEHLSVIIWQEEATRGTMPPPMSALITAKDANDDLVEVVLFEKFNDLRGFGRRLFLPFEQLISYGTTTLNIEVVLGRQSPSFSLKLLRRMINIAKKADERMRQLNIVNKRLHEKTHSHVKKAIDEILSGSLPSITSPHKPALPKLEIDEMMKNEVTDKPDKLEPIKCTLNLKRSSSPSSSKTSSSDPISFPKKRLRSRAKPASNEAPSSSVTSRRVDTT